MKDGSYPITDMTLMNELPRDIEVIQSPIFEPYEWYKILTGKGKNDKILTIRLNQKIKARYTSCVMKTDDDNHKGIQSFRNKEIHR